MDWLVQSRLPKPCLELIHKGIASELTGQGFILHVTPAKLCKSLSRKLYRIVACGKNRVKVVYHVLGSRHIQPLGQVMEYLMHGDSVVACLIGAHSNVLGASLVVPLHSLGYTVHALGAYCLTQAQRFYQVFGDLGRADFRRSFRGRRNTLQRLLRGVFAIF